MNSDFFDKIQVQFNNRLPFVAYRRPNTLELRALLQKDDLYHKIVDYKETGFVFAPFDAADEAVLIPLNQSEEIIVSQVDHKVFKPFTKEIIESAEYKIGHLELVKKGVEAIKKKQFEKVVLSRRENFKLTNGNPIELLKKLLITYPSAFVYCWFHPKVGLWLGATPETLIKIEGNRFSIMALAGTQNYKGTMDVAWANKEMQEQQIVTDFIVENLTPLVENLKVSEVKTVKAGNLLHLCTMISANLKPENLNLKNILSVLHPTPAVCGLPKQAAKDFILRNENYDREFYSGFLGELNLDVKISPRSGKRNTENSAYAINKKSTQLYVNLRCMKMHNDNALIYVGGGVTKYSIPEDEWNETVSKSLVIKNILL